jgi:alpha-ketoglutarate-dependent taurine dioxygenase
MNDVASVKRLWTEPDRLGVEWADGDSAEFASVWLRDNRREDRDPHSGQRLVDIVDVPAAPRIRWAEIHSGAVSVQWEAEPEAASFDIGWLRAHAATRSPARARFEPRLWLQGAALEATRDFKWLSFTEARQDRTLRAQWLERLLQDGIAFLSNAPPRDDGIFEVASMTGRLLETNYGAAFDVRSVPQPENLAYSDLGLGLHTDNPYREPVPGFQVLHALVTSPAGGDSLFGDGFAIAGHLRSTAPDAFAVLTQVAVPFEYRSKDADLYAERPLIQLSCSGEVVAVQYNSRSIAPLRLGRREVETFYDAYRRFAALLRESRFHLRFRLRDGDVVVFDNRRTLHGRSAFSSARHPRHLRGCYLTRDSVYSEAAVLQRG